MKSVIYAAVLAVAIILFVWWSGLYIDRSIHPVIEGVDQMSRAITNDNWQQARIVHGDVSEKWQNSLNDLQYLMKHAEMDAISIQLNKLKWFLELETPDNAHGEIESLKALLEDLPKQDDVSWENFL